MRPHSSPRTTTGLHGAGMRDSRRWGELERKGAVILREPVSPRKHVKFREEYGLPFTLLSDEAHEVACTALAAFLRSPAPDEFRPQWAVYVRTTAERG